MPDKYVNFNALKAEENSNDYRIVSRNRSSRPIVIAPHGGKIEPGTSEIATAIAGTDFSLYLFEGVKNVSNGDLHITSSRFDEPKCLELLEASHIAIAIHGCTGVGEFVEVGGRHSRLGKRIGAALSAIGIEVRPPRNPALAGKDTDNVVNRAKGGQGVQLEFSRSLRDRFCEELSNESEGAFARALVAAIREPISQE